MRHVDLLINRHEPWVVVMYAGDNDVTRGNTPQQVANDFKAFVWARIRNNDVTFIEQFGLRPERAHEGWTAAHVAQQMREELDDLRSLF